jgi:hypothetical protein
MSINLAQLGRWGAVTLASLEAGWMVFDGARALVAGDYVTPSSGEHRGELGPWTRLVEAVGIEPRSTRMKLIFVAYGGTWLAVVRAYVRGLPWARRGMLAAAAGSLWYLWIGTVSGVIQLGLLVIARERPPSRRARPADGRRRRRRPGSSFPRPMHL